MSRSKFRCLQNQLRSEWQSINRPLTFICAIASLILGLISAVLTGGYKLYALLCLPENAPFSFIYPIVWSALYLLIGAATGAVIFCSDKSVCRYKSRGLLYFGVMFFLNLIWSPIFFGCELLFCGFVIACAVTVLTFFVILCYSKIYLLCSFAMLLYFFWLVYMVYVNLAVVFLN